MNNLERFWKNGLHNPFIFFLLFFTSLFLFTLPGNKVPTVYWLHIPHVDKYVHTCIFIALCTCAYQSIQYYFPAFNNRNVAIFIVLLLLTYGVGIECIQDTYIADRSFELMDIVADAIGCLIFLAGYFYFAGKAS